MIYKAEVQALRADLKWKLVTRLFGAWLVVGIAMGIGSCDQSVQTRSELVATTSTTALATTEGPLSEVNIPASISRLAPSLAKFQPQVQILSPKPDETLTDDRVTVKLNIKDFPLFKQPQLGLGNHLHVILDKQTYQGVYDLNQPLVFKNLAAGTHSLRVFASRPWHESFKNAGAYAQVSFNVFTKTAENNPDPNQPLLTYSRPTGIYGAEPIMLDYYLTNAPVAKDQDDTQGVPKWRIRVTVNEQRFILDRWAPVYLQGFKPGKNLVKLELLNDRGDPIPNVYNDSVSIVTYDPQTKDTLAQLIRGEIDSNLERSLVDPSYVVIEPAPIPTVTPAPIPAPISVPVPLPVPVVVAPAPKPDPEPVKVAPVIPPTPIARTPVTITPEPAKAEPIKPVLPAPIPTPIQKIQPSVPVAKAPPVETPIPEPAKTAPIIPDPQLTTTPTPDPIVVPAPVETKVIIKKDLVPAPIVDRQISIPKLQSPQPVEQQPLLAPPTISEVAPKSNQIASPQLPTPETIVVAPAPTNTWQIQANELRKAAGVKIRAFTNTIPAKAQRFGHNVQIWVGNAIDQIQAWRAAHVD